MAAVLVVQEMGLLPAVRVGKDIPAEVGPELCPKERDFLLCNGFSDGDFVFHLFSSKCRLEG